MIIEKDGNHFEGDKKYYIDGAVTFKELAELIILLFRNEDRRIILYEMAPEDFQGRKMLAKFLAIALELDEVPIPPELLRKFKLYWLF